MAISNAILEAIEVAKPELAASYTRLITRQFNEMVRALGADLKNVYNHYVYARPFSMSICRFVNKVNNVYTINEEKLTIGAASFADNTANEWIDKINEKLGELDHASVKYFDSHSFTIIGERNGKKISIEQQRILKCSSKGVWFNQFPARIYVNGKFTSAAAYKKMFAV